MFDFTHSDPAGRRNHVSCFEEIYSGPKDLLVLPLSVPFERVRKRNGQSPDTEELAARSPSLVVEDYRCAGPKYVPFPRQERVRFDLFGHRLNSPEGRQKVKDILLQHGLDEVYTRYVLTVENAIGNADVLQVCVRDPKVNDRWIQAASSLINMCRMFDLPTVNVELANEWALAGTTSSPIFESERLVQDWSSIQPRVLESLKPNVTWLSIEVLSRTKHLRVSDTQITTPTIFIRITIDSDEDWDAPCTKIERILQENEEYKRFALEITRVSDISLTDTAKVDDQDQHKSGRLWAKKAYMGASIGPTEGRSSGTYAACVRVTQKSTKESKVYALTSFQVVVPQPSSMTNPEQPDHVNAWPSRGISPGDKMAQKISISMPTTVDHYDYLAECQERIEEIRTRSYGSMTYDAVRSLVEEGTAPRTVLGGNVAGNFLRDREELERNQNLVQVAHDSYGNRKGFFGTVFAASGLRQRQGNLMDWALISPAADRIPETNKFLNGWGGEGPFRHLDHMCRYRQPAEQDKVMKIGRASGPTQGFVNAIESTQNLGGFDENGAYRTGLAWTITPAKSDRHFSLMGDSGSAIVDRQGNFLGLLFCGDVRGQTGNSDVTYFTGAVDLIRDMEESLGADVELLGADEELLGA